MVKENIKIEDMIFEVRGKQVILASDVAKLYQVETKRINEVVKRNINRFPEDFCFKLSKVEIDELCSRSQFATLKIIHLFLDLLVENKMNRETYLYFFLLLH